MNQKPNVAEELGYPAWVVPFAAFVIFVMGGIVIYAAISFVALTIFFNEWHCLLRMAYLGLLSIWCRLVFRWAGEINADADEE